MAFNKLAKRVAAGAVLIPLALVVTYRGGPVFAAFIVLLAGLAGWEFQRMVRSCGHDVSGAVIIAGSIAVAVSFYLGALAASALVFTFVAMIAFVERLVRANMEDYLLSVSLTLAGVFYTGWLLGFFILLREFPAPAISPGMAEVKNMGGTLIFLVLILSWCNDSGAYFLGSSIGSHRLSRISPSKTIEGTLGGLACCVAAALVSRATFASFLGIKDAVVVGLLIGACCVLGDLVESMMKRSTGIKDSSNIIPGHGGLLDRFDSLLFAGPVFYLYARAVFSGVWS